MKKTMSMKKTILVLAMLAGSIGAGGAAAGGGFDGFRGHERMRLLSALDDALSHEASQMATGMIADNFAAMRKIDIHLQTALGGRKGNVGAHLIGDFDRIAKAEDRAFGWQLRGYAGQESSKGVNAGVFYRKKEGDVLLGGNLFVDYERQKSGNFFRYSAGGEIRGGLLSLAANYYLPSTGKSKSSNGVRAAFSREGYDAKLHLAAPQLRVVQAAAEYYHFKGEDGTRYGVKWDVIPALRVGVFYDGGGKEWGGDIAYSYTIGGAQPKAAGNGGGEFAPDMLSESLREYAQRIATE